MIASETPFIWSESESAGRNQYRFFRYNLDLADRPDSGSISVFADTRYRLYLNGKILGHGPCRFKKHAPLSDTYDLVKAGMRAGRNTIAIVVCSYGDGTFISDSSTGGLIAAGFAIVDGREINFSTKHGWKVSTATGYAPDQPLMSFALGMMEDQDTRLVPADWMEPSFDDSLWPDAVPVLCRENWGQVRDGGPPLTEEVCDRQPAEVSAFAASRADDWTVRGLTIEQGDASGNMAAVAITLDAPHRGAFPIRVVNCSRLWMNGLACELRNYDEDSDSFETVIEALGGDNLLIVELPLNRGFAQWALAFRNKDRLNLCQDAPGQSKACFLEFFEKSPADGWSHWKNRLSASEPCRALVLSESKAPIGFPRALRSLSFVGKENRWPVDVPVGPDAPDRVWLFDFCREVNGRIVIDFEATAGTELIFTGSERLGAHGTVHTGTQTTRLHCRLVARGGRQRWMAMHPMGLRYLELWIRHADGPVRLHSVSLARMRPVMEETGRFQCSDSTLNMVWNLCRETLVYSIEYIYVDSPWRERGLYTGDQVIQYDLSMVLVGDQRFMRRTIGIIFSTQDGSGLLSPCSHFLPTFRHPDYTALAVELLSIYVNKSGDYAFAVELREPVRKVLTALLGLRNPQSGLVEALGRVPYVDMSRINRGGTSLGLNAFIYGGLMKGLELLERQDGAGLDSIRSECAAYRNAIQARFWSPEHSLYVDRLDDEVEVTGPSGLGNALAIRYGIVTPEQLPLCLDFVEDCARNNLPVLKTDTTFDFHYSAYTSYYLLQVLYESGRIDTAEQFIRREWRRMLDGGAHACWEYFVPSHSLCHPWAATAASYLSNWVLGLRPEGNGNPDAFIFDPHPGSVEWAEGAIPHPRGPIRARWRMRNGELESSVDAPEGVLIRMETGG